jgi:thioredoxin 1
MNFFRGTFLGLWCQAAALLMVGQAAPTPAQGAAPTQGKPALYEFGAGYCVSCKEMAKIMAELQANYGNQLEVRMVYADKEKDLFKHYKIMLIPTQVFLDAAGKEVDRHIGALSKEEVIKKLKELKFIH